MARILIEKGSCSALSLNIGWGTVMSKKNQDTFIIYITGQNIEGLGHLESDRSIYSLVDTTPRVKRYKYLDLSYVEIYIFFLFAVMNESVTESIKSRNI